MRSRGLPVLALLLAGCRTASTPPVPPSLPAPSVPASPARPEDPLAALLAKEAIGLEDLLAFADARNPDLAADRRELDIAGIAVEEAGLRPNPSGVVSVEEWRTRDGATAGRTERTLGIRFPVVVGGRIGAATSAAEKRREAAAFRYAWRRREVLGGVKGAYVALLAARKELALAGEASADARGLRDRAEERFRAQVAPEMEVLKAGVHLAEAERRVREAENERAVALGGLRALLGGASVPEERVRGDLAARFALPPGEDPAAWIEPSHPLLEEARCAREAAEREVSLARAEATPDFGLELAAGVGPEDDAIVEGSLEFPLPFFHRNGPRIAAAEARVLQAGLRAEAVRNDLRLRLALAHRGLLAAADRHRSYEEEILPRARKALEQTDEGYRQGKFGFLEVLDAQRTLAESRAAHLSALADLNARAMELETLSGRSLEPVR